MELRPSLAAAEELLKKIEFLITGLEKIENERKIKDADGAVEEFTAQ